NRNRSRCRHRPQSRPPCPRLSLSCASGRKIALFPPERHPPLTYRERAPMPELPEVETVRRGLALKMTGRTIVAAELRRQDLRRPLPPMLARTLTGAAIGKLTRRGKYILIE